MFGVTGAGLNKIKNMQSGGKRHRWSVDQWDKVGQPCGEELEEMQGTTRAIANCLTAKCDRSPDPGAKAATWCADSWLQ